MRRLFLFYTSAAAGAPGYLSRQGEQSAENLAETLYAFLTQTLELDLASEAEARANSLTNDLRWRLHRDQSKIESAIENSLAFFPQILLLSGASHRCIKTTEYLASALALPVVVDNGLDAPIKSPQSPSTLNESLIQLNAKLNSGNLAPSVLLVSTSLEALSHWLKPQLSSDIFDAVSQSLVQASANDNQPAVVSCGFDAKSGWIFDF